LKGESTVELLAGLSVLLGSFGFDLGVALGDALNVLHSFEVRRDAPAELIDPHRARVISGQGQGEIVVVAAEEFTKIARAAIHVLLRIEDVFYSEVRGGLRQELHQAARVLGGDRVGIEIRFDSDNTMDEVGVDTVAFGGSADDLLEGGGAAKGLRDRLEDLFGFDADDIFEEHLGHAPFQVETIAITKDFVSSDVQARAAAKDDIIGASRRGRGKEDDCEQSTDRDASDQQPGTSWSANRAIATATPSSSLDRVTCQPRSLSSGTLFPMTTGVPAKDNISKSL